MPSVVELTPAHFEAWTKLFDATGHLCYCRYWHFEGTKNDWLARSADGGAASRSEAEALLRTGSESGRGLIAIEDEEGGERVIGWLKLVPIPAVPKLRRMPVYRALPLDEEPGAFVIACILVHPEKRKRGVATLLVREASRFAEAWGATALLALPYRTETPVHDDVLLMGPESVYPKAGFTCSLDRPPYPIWRKNITLP